MDILELDRSIQIAKEAVLGGADWIEAGTPLIKSVGMDAVREMKKALPGVRILADMKTVDTGAMEVEMAAKAGADIVALLASSDNSTIEDALRAARKYGVQIMMDLLTVPDPVKRSRELEALGVDYICVHVGIDQQMTGRDTVDFLKEIVKVVNIPVAAAGGIDAVTGADAVANGAAIVIVGGSIVRSAQVTASAQKIREAIDHARISAAPKMSREEEMIAIFREVSGPNISDAMHRKGAMRGILPINLGIKIVGKAVTVQTFPGDWAKPVESIDMAGPGDVLVIYNGSNSISPWGGLATLSCKMRGVEGAVIDGAVRDVDEIRALKYPIWASGITPNAGDPKGMGEINSEITCGGQTVKPGDYIVADENGVVVIPKERAYEIARRAKEVEKMESRLYEEIRRGSTLSQVANLKKWEKA
ncbi:MAG: bifunctional hexulose-6-phosphate synthase/ribonuclease regulator [Methanothrix sp.]|nr:bifunctional hexulose-6-phosphate synthase/ribonuclease regulator [Methanothrix sp.]